MAYARQNTRRRHGLGASSTLIMPALDLANYTRAMKESALKAAAAQMAVSVALEVVPIVGWVVGLIYSLVGVFAGRYDKAKIKEVQNALTDYVNNTAAAYSARYDGDVSTVYNQELANALADVKAGNTGLAGNFFQDVGQTLAKGFAQTAVAIPRAAGVTVLKIAAVGAQAIGAKSVATKLSSGETQYIALAAKGTTALTHDVTHGNDAVSHAGDTARMVTGEQQVFDARRQAASIEDQFNAKIQAQYALQVAQIQSPAFRATLRATLVSMLVANPGAMTALVTNNTRNMVVAAAGAAVVGWFAFLKH